MPVETFKDENKANRLARLNLENWIAAVAPTLKTYWVDYLFSRKPFLKGYWRYEIDYTGRGGSLDKYEIRYDPAKEIFVGNLISTGGEND